MIMLLDNGNTTYYEYLYGEKPSKIEEFVISIEDDTKVCLRLHTNCNQI